MTYIVLKVQSNSNQPTVKFQSSNQPSHCIVISAIAVVSQKTMHLTVDFS